MKTLSDIKPGTKVLYYQPGIDEILSSWAKEPIKFGDPGGNLKEATVTEIKPGRYEGETFYYIDNGMLLTDSDIREVL